MRRAISNVLLAMTTVAALYVGVVVRFQNPDMTETRLLITFWPQCLAVLVLLCAGLIVRGER